MEDFIETYHAWINDSLIGALTGLIIAMTISFLLLVFVDKAMRKDDNK